jgi:hypothetical protein
MHSSNIKQFIHPQNRKFMTSYQEAYEKMSLSRSSYLTANAAITATLTGFSTYIQTTLAQILTAKVLQEADKSGDTTAKNQLRASLIAQAMEIIRRVIAYTTNTNNNSLRELVNYSETKLKKSSDQQLATSCQVIRDNANTNVTALATYGVTAVMITTFQTTINNLNVLIPKGRVTTTDSGEATQTLVTLFKTLTTNWDKIDTLVEIVKTSQPSFYDEYHKVGKVIVLGRSSLPLKVKTTNAITGAPEPNVILTLIPVNGQLKASAANGRNSIIKKSALGGGSNYKNLPDGTYILEAEKPGFKKVTETVNVVNGEYTLLEIKMEKA